jgi:hypothetical protein
VQRCPYGVEQCLPGKKEGNGKSGTSQTDPEYLLVRPRPGQHHAAKSRQHIHHRYHPGNHFIRRSDPNTNHNSKNRGDCASLCRPSPARSMPIYYPDNQSAGANSTRTSGDFDGDSLRDSNNHWSNDCASSRDLTGRRRVGNTSTPAGPNATTRARLAHLSPPPSCGRTLLFNSITRGRPTSNIRVPNRCTGRDICHERRSYMAGQHVQWRRQRVVTQGDKRYTIPRYLSGLGARESWREDLKRV